MDFKFPLPADTLGKTTLIRIIMDMLTAKGNILAKGDRNFFTNVLINGKLVFDGKPYGLFAFITSQTDKYIVLSDFLFLNALPYQPTPNMIVTYIIMI